MQAPPMGQIKFTKLARGSFPASFFLAPMKAIGRQQVNLADV
jgi:hypothetical protein